MKTVLTLLLSFISVIALAQPTLTQANEATLGSAFTYNYVDTANVNPGNGGVAQTWNFSNVTPSGLSQVDSWVDPGSTPYAANYPTATLVQSVNNGTGNNIYQYHKLTSSTTEVLGIASNLTGSPSIMIYSNPEIIRQIPATYNSTMNDSYSGSSTLTIGPITATTHRNGFYQYIVDGYGTLITPVGNYPSTLRFKVRQVLTDSTVYTGSPLPPQIINHISTTYFWASCSAGDRLYQFHIGYDTLITSSGTTIDKSVSYLESMTGLQEQGVFGISYVGVYPNPVSGTAHVKISNALGGDGLLVLYNAEGKEVMQYNTVIQPSDHFTWEFSTYELPAGIYLARITCGDQQWMAKVIKE